VLAVLARRARAGIERILVGRAIEQVGIGLDHGLRALAVMDVEVEDGDAADAEHRLRVARADGDIVDQAKAPGNIGRGVMAGRPHGGKCRVRLALEYGLHAFDHGARRALRRLGAAGAHGGVAVDHDDLAGRRPDAQDRLDVVCRMHALQLLERGERRRRALQVGEGFRLERAQHRAQTVGALGMVFAGVVLEERRVGDQQSRHRRHSRLTAP
jgi:hypothetical protein